MDNLFFSKSEIACIGDGNRDHISSCRRLFQTSLSCLSSQLNTFLGGEWVGKGIKLINYLHSDIFLCSAAVMHLRSDYPKITPPCVDGVECR